MQDHPKLIPGQLFHIYNRGINSCAIFREEENYAYFLRLYEKHVAPVFTTYAWALLPTHFHMLVEVKELAANPDSVQNPVRVVSHQLSKLFNAYAQAFNKRFCRHGSLFERPFKRKLIQDDHQLINTLIYIHNNPVHHGYCKYPSEYGWSSYHDYISDNPAPPLIDFRQQFFDNIENFIYLHEQSAQKLDENDWID